MDKELSDFLYGATGFVEASSAEYHFLWKEYHDETFGQSWSENLSGIALTIGRVNDLPVCVSLRKSVVNGHLLVFYYATSRMVDHTMVDEWIQKIAPPTARHSDGRANKTDAMNFTNVFQRR